ncbi:something about silencing protein 10 [Erinaceus europaeus]|uniref:Something about silencing protein 10 n=1 Tax=Erinaceus europaeus TaxID=9365 RepID=A0A1S2ZRV6_ERIEU|nr:something about silencing protein 10 [Erinaceus europaeus]
MVGRSRRRGAAKWAAVRAKAAHGAADVNDNDMDPPPSPGDPSYFQDQVDHFHEARARAALAKGWDATESGDEDEDDEEEVMALDVEDEEDGDSERDDDDDDDDDDGGGSSEHSEAEASADPSLSWGQRKKLYYDTDYGGSKARGRRSQQEEEEEEREEEEEAQLIQRRLAQALQEDDFGVTWVEAFAKPVSRPEEAETRVAKDLAKVSVKEKLKMLRKESPELLELLDDLKAKLTEVSDELEPLLQMAEQGVIAPGRGSQYLRTKYHLYLNYCANISFYLVLKARRIPASGHPVIERLVTYRNLINQLAPVDQQLTPEIRCLLALRDGTDPKAKLTRAKPRRATGSAAVTQVGDGSDLEEEAALSYYQEMEDKQKLKRKKEERDAEEAALEDPNAKRAITYQIAKNRGLTPRRKKIDRNPRVKHREKFRRARIRRRGQVREVRREEQRYSGELSGIRAGVKKSIKLK